METALNRDLVDDNRWPARGLRTPVPEKLMLPLTIDLASRMLCFSFWSASLSVVVLLMFKVLASGS